MLTQFDSGLCATKYFALSKSPPREKNQRNQFGRKEQQTCGVSRGGVWCAGMVVVLVVFILSVQSGHQTNHAYFPSNSMLLFLFPRIAPKDGWVGKQPIRKNRTIRRHRARKRHRKTVQYGFLNMRPPSRSHAHPSSSLV